MPVSMQPTSTHTTPTKSPNTNHKRPMANHTAPPSFEIKTEDDVDPDGTITAPKRQIRCGDRLKNARAALIKWCLDVKLARYSPSPFTAEVILPDTILTTLASNAQINTLTDLAGTLKKPWMLMDKLGKEVVKVLHDADQRFQQATEDARKAQREARKAASSIGEPLTRSSQFNVTAQVGHGH